MKNSFLLNQPGGRKVLRTALAVFSVFFLTAGVFAEGVDKNDPLAVFPSRVHKITLKNGMRILVVERPEAQTISFAMYIRTGAMDDESGKSGLAHMFEHMLFKGTKTIGTKNFKEEAPLLDEIDRVTKAFQNESDKGAGADLLKIKNLQQALDQLNKKHETLLIDEEFWRIYERAGAQNVHASTGEDFTDYTVSLPINYLPLWFTMEADRIKNPVLREFYKERSVVMEERRLRTDTSPQGKLWEAFLAAAFMAHPYGRPTIGWESDITHLTRQDAQTFFKAHYDISRLVVGIAGGVKASEIEAMARQYFEPIPSHKSDEVGRISVEPEQEGERRVQVEFDAEPAILIGYHRPDMNDPDNPAISAWEDIMSLGRSSRLYKNVVDKKRIAVSAWATGSAPGERDPNLIVLGGSPRAPHTAEELEKAIDEEVERLKKEGPTAQELEKVKNNMESGLIRGLSSNEGLAGQLAYYESVAGDWHYLLWQVEAIRKLTPADVQKVVAKYLIPSHRTVAILVRKKP